MLLDISGNLSFLNYLITSMYLEKHENNSVIISTYRQTVLEVATYFKLSSIFSVDSAVDAFAIDDIQNKFRFTLVYSLQSSTNNISIQIITKVTDGSFVCSLQSIFPAFNWAEREIWDLSGIFFLKHPDLRRILTDYGFSGHPLRKDFPVSGFREVYYSDISKQVLYDKIELTQNFRLFSITSNWAYAETI